MYVIPALALLGALFADQQGPQDSEAYGGHYGALDLVSQLKAIDDQMYKTTKQALGLAKGLKLAAKSAHLTQLGAERDALISTGAPPNAPNVLDIDSQFRAIVASVIGQALTGQLERATQGLRARRDALVHQIGAAGLIRDWTKYGGHYGLLLRDDMFGQDEVDDFTQSPEYQEWLTQLGDPVEITAEQQVTGILAIATATFMAQVDKYIPKVHGYDIRGGQDTSGAKYAKVTLQTTDPYKVLQRAAAYALQTAGAHGVSVTTQPSTQKGQVVLIFSQGVAPITP